MKQPFYLIAGLGKTGRSIAGFLQRRHRPFAVFDTRAQVDGLAEFKRDFAGVDVFLEDLPDAMYSKITEIIASPGLSLQHPLFEKARLKTIPVVGDIECLAREIKAPAVAITGTNGKSTVTTLVGDMARKAKLSVAVAGNIGTPVLDLLDNDIDYDLWVLELSSFQLDLIETLAPQAATILNISEDHLDRHSSLGAYVAAKQKIYRQAKTCIFNREDTQTIPIEAEKVAKGSKQISFGLEKAESPDWGIVQSEGRHYLAKGNEVLIAVDELGIKGRQNWANALAACAIAEAIGLKQESMQAVLRSFTGLPHRCQWLRTIDQVAWINDSKGTNTGAAIAAISGIGANLSARAKIILIAGGLGKGADFRELQGVVGSYVRTLVLIGKDAPLIEEALSGVAPVIHAQSLQDAVLKARDQAQVGDVVLLSPACASFDMFRDFNHRGEAFAKLVSDL